MKRIRDRDRLHHGECPAAAQALPHHPWRQPAGDCRRWRSIRGQRECSRYTAKENRHVQGGGSAQATARPLPSGYMYGGLRAVPLLSPFGDAVRGTEFVIADGIAGVERESSLFKRGAVVIGEWLVHPASGRDRASSGAVRTARLVPLEDRTASVPPEAGGPRRSYATQLRLVSREQRPPSTVTGSSAPTPSPMRPSRRPALSWCPPA